MIYTLILVMMMANGDIEIAEFGSYTTQIECRDNQDDVMEILGLPKFNYDVICMATDMREGESAYE